MVEAGRIWLSQEYKTVGKRMAKGMLYLLTKIGIKYLKWNSFMTIISLNQ